MTCACERVITHASGSAVTLTAAASTGSNFTGWLGACSGTGTCNVSINDATRVGATLVANAILPPRIDLDNTRTYSALTEGMLITCYLSGATGNALAGGATLVDAAQLARRFNNMRPIFDIDRNGQVDTATDGVLLMRYLFGLRGTALTAGAVVGGATRTNPSDVESYIPSITP